MDKIKFLTKEEHENLGIGKQVSPTYIQIELPNNVPSRVKPIVIFPTAGAKTVTVQVTEYDNYGVGKRFYTIFEPNQSHVINLNTGVE